MTRPVALAFDEAVRYVELAADCAERLAEVDAEMARLFIRLAEARLATGDAAASLTASARAVEAGDRADRPDLMALAGLVIQGVGDPLLNDEVRVLCERALDALGDQWPDLRARLLAQVAVAAAENGGGPAAQQLATQALAAARSCGDLVAEVEAIAARHLSIAVPDTVAERLELGRRAVELSARVRHPMAGLWRADAAFQLGNLIDVDREMAEINRIAEQRNSVQARWHRHRRERPGPPLSVILDRLENTTRLPPRWPDGSEIS
jgi:hypothetical protein